MGEPDTNAIFHFRFSIYHFVIEIAYPKEEKGEVYKFPKQLFGEENCLYDFEIVGDHIGEDGVKLTLKITQYIAGSPPHRLSPALVCLEQWLERFLRSPGP